MSDRQLGDAMKRHTEGIDPEQPPWASIEDRAAALPTHRRFTPVMITLATVAAAVLLVAAAVVLRPDPSSNRHVATDPGDTTTTLPDETSTTTSTTAPQVAVRDPASVHSVYPFATQGDLGAYRSSGNKGFSDPRQVAWSFAHKFLGMPNAVTAEYTPGGACAGAQSCGAAGPGIGTVEVRPEAGNPQITVVTLEQVAPDAWTVVGATTDAIRVATPVGGATVASPVHVTGQSTAFEATIQVDVLTAGEHPTTLKQQPVMGGANGQMGAFDAAVSFPAPSSATPGVIAFYIISAKDGSVSAATVVGVTLSP
jgi:hypothetical protein